MEIKATLGCAGEVNYLLYTGPCVAVLGQDSQSSAQDALLGIVEILMGFSGQGTPRKDRPVSLLPVSMPAIQRCVNSDAETR